MAEEPPPVTVSGGAAPAQALPRRPWSPRRRVAVLAAAGLLLAVYVASAVQDAGRRSDARRAATAERREIAALHLAVTTGGTVPRQQGITAAPVQAAQVSLGIRNAGPRSVRLVGADLDGTRTAVDVELSPGREVALGLTWRVRCAEIGNALGPRRLELAVRGRSGTHQVMVDVTGRGTGELFHRAAAQACDVLVRG